MTGRRNRAQTPSRFLPPRPSSPFGFLYGSKKLVSEKFWLQQTAVKFSANIIGCCSICLREFFSCRVVVNAAVSTLRCQHCGVVPPLLSLAGRLQKSHPII